MIMPVPLPIEVQEQINYRSADSFAHRVGCELPFGKLESVLVWTRCECHSDWRWDVEEMATDIANGRYRFYFDSERDAVAFSLQWA